jgi:Fur family ferric uptake transcriptional regulator
VPSKTKQRSSILAALKNINQPVTPSELLNYASINSPGLGIATVYRYLKRLVASSQVRKIEAVGVPPHYEIIYKKDHRHFFVCNVCEKLSAIKRCSNDFKDLLIDGYKIKSCEVIIYGECRECST